MIRVHRLTARAFARRAYSGEGARLYGGRWDGPGVRVVYTSGSLSLAVLELFVHVDPEDVPASYHVVTAEIPPSVGIKRLSFRELPQGWRRTPGPPSLRDLGDRWVEEAKSPVLAVPSAVVPDEWNYLLNPVHPDFRKIRILASRPFRFDPRLIERS